ncbi:mechanosensitive ion channel family protein [Bacteriovorax sp. Seq25_V]|uniref:mechanosensitive ion channel family protein n=1 Tax=Bacteriovorax sp. Seq25_V TaxID=1201288 RepID=UPI00038A4A4F|nr:mechanosensitive ion channel family protein [Bacteriovorax sp. Seq25_V]EQC44175.1 transporter, small conductance mechanosensitive ion channel MscS family protein [Bacteriovorax sp. Seq25_V]
MQIKALIISLICLISFAEAKYPEASLSSPRDTMNYFLKTMKGFKLGDQEAIKLATKALDTAHFSKAIAEVKSEDFAVSLSQVIDKIEYVDVNKIPEKTEYDIWYFRKEKLDGNNDVEISIIKMKEDGKWKFSKATYDSLKFYESALASKEIISNVVADKSLRQEILQKLPSWTKRENLILKNYQWIAILFIILTAFIFDRLVRFYIASKLIQFLANKNISFTSKERKRITYPFGLFTFIAIFNLLVAKINLDEEVLSILFKLADIGMAFAMVLIISSVVDIVCVFLERKAKLTENKFDDVLVPLIKKTAKFFIYCFGIIYVGDALDLNMKNILAGMGIGGIAFALAAKDTVSNLFGSFTVLIDRPFSIGDWVVINGDITGSVEEVGLRSTRIRTAYDSLVTVPNGTLTNANIDNYGKRKYRRFITTLGIDYDTPVETIENFCEAIRQVIIAHPHTRKDSFHVYFNNLGASSLDIYLSVFWAVPDLAAELCEKHNLLLDIMRIARDMNVNFAFPTQTLHLLNEAKPVYEKSEINYDLMKAQVDRLKNERTLMSQNRSSIDLIEKDKKV